MQGVQEAGGGGERTAPAPRPAVRETPCGETGSPRVPGHTAWPSWHNPILKNRWRLAGRGALSGEERNKLAQFYTKKVHKVSDCDKTVPAVFLPEARCSVVQRWARVLLPVPGLPSLPPLSPPPDGSWGSTQVFSSQPCKDCVAPKLTARRSRT